MVWPFTSSNDPSSTPPTSTSKPDVSADPFSKLDPSLRQFLKRESPGEYNASATPKRELTAREKTNLVAVEPARDSESTTPPTAAAPKRAAPPSLYPDGRYDHLWSTYRSRAEIEGETATDQIKLETLAGHWQDRRNSVKRAAMENCAAVNTTLDECFRRPNFKQRAVMCRYETRALNRCIEMNQRFLKALGYLSANRTELEEEAIQMHADKLYTRMMAQEKMVADAKAEGREIPKEEEPDTFFKEDKKTATAIFDLLTDEGRERLKERKKGMNPAEKDIEERVFAAELEAGYKTMAKIDKHRAEVRKARLERIDTGKARATDRFQAWFGW